MDLHHISIRNFCSIKHIELALNQPGLVLIKGINADAPLADSNGSGKSILLEAICWCLWGETIRDLTGDEVVNRAFGKDCVVALTFQVEGKKYTVARHRLDTSSKKPNDLTIAIDGKQVQSAPSMAATQELVNQIVGFDFTTFCAMMPGTGIKVAKMTDKAVKDILESLLQTKQLAAAGDLAKQKSKDLELVIAGLQAKKKALEVEVASTQRHMADLEQLIQDREARQEEIVTQCEAALTQTNAEIAEHEKSLAIYDNTDVAYATAKSALAAIQKLTSDYTKQQEKQTKAIEDKIHSTKNKLAVSSATVTQHASLLEKTKSQTDCVHCEQSLPAEKHACLLQQAQSEYTRLFKFDETLKQDLLKLTAQLEQQTKEHLKFCETLESKNKIAEDEYALQTENQWKSKVIQTDLRNLKLNRAKEEVALLEAKKSNSSYTEKFDALKATLASCEESLSALSTQEEETQKQLSLYQFWVTGFGPAGLRSYMLDFVTPILNDRAAYYSNILTSGELKVSFSTKSTLKTGVEKDKFSVNCEYQHGSNSYKGASTGERARIDLIVSLALGDLAQFRTAKQLPWRFLDEPFESIDRSGTEAIVRLLNDQKSRYKTVFVVTHRPDFSDLFTQTLTVIKKDGITSIKDDNES